MIVSLIGTGYHEAKETVAVIHVCRAIGLGAVVRRMGEGKERGVDKP
ncbi:hypothetical protein [Ferrimicrobium sp.]|nr:hypothetical protein [Ferrimicrobium sp.]